MQPLVEELIPAPDPWEVARKLAHLPNLLFLDSADGDSPHGRYSYVMADPDHFGIRWLNEKYYLENAYVPLGERLIDPFGSYGWIKKWFKPHSQLPPFQGGYVWLYGYDLNRETERLPKIHHVDIVPAEYARATYTSLVSFDHSQRRAWCMVLPEISGDRRSNERKARNRLKQFVSMIRTHSPNQAPRAPRKSPALASALFRSHALERFGNVSSNFTREDYLSAVKQAIDYIHAGDIFQVNLSQRLMTPLAEHPLEVYRRLRSRNPAPFACYFDAGWFQILSASPERFLKVDSDRTIITNPIKGTRPRGKTPEEDAKLLHDLVTNPKDRAENVMIVDLLRNDIGKVAEFGSVTVPKVCEVESYSYVHHLVSEVRGKLRADKTPFDLLKAAFPGGSVTGAPKVRAMEIIAELEPTARGPYCGSIGFIGFDGVMDTNILIRTFTAAGGWLQFPVGGGIVADSDPETEYEETLTKAQGLLRALT